MNSISLHHLNGKVAVVTGASSGIGRAVVKALVSKGLQVIGLARRMQKLQELSMQMGTEAGLFFPFQADVTIEEDIVNAFKWVKENVGPIDVLVNGAGLVRAKGVIDGETKSWKDIFDTNVLGLCIATREAVENMRKNNVAGHIIHINSVLGHTVSMVGLYSPSKWAVTALTETLRQELNFIGSKIRVTSISPGKVTTEMVSDSDIILTPEQQEFFDAMPSLQPEDIADAVVYVLSTPPHVQVHELIIRPIGEGCEKYKKIQDK